MLTNFQNRLPFPFLLVVGLVSGCAGDAPPAEPETMFPGPPDLYLTVDPEPGTPELDCAAECCGIPEDGLVLYIDVGNWLLAPHEECGDEPQCGPVVLQLRTLAGVEHEFEIQTTEPKITIDVVALVEQASLEEWPWHWMIFGRTVPRPEFGQLLGSGYVGVQMLDEAARLKRDALACNFEEDRFYVYAEIGPTAAAGAYVMRAGLDEAEVTCTFEVITLEGGPAQFEIPEEDDCAPAGLVSIVSEHLDDSPEVPGGLSRLRINPRHPVERVSFEVSHAGEVLFTGSHEPAGERVLLDGEECTVIPCQIAPAWGASL